jgi:hypothetical protein
LHYYDQYVHRNNTGLCVVGLAPSHQLLQTRYNPATQQHEREKTITRIDWNVGKQDR